MTEATEKSLLTYEQAVSKLTDIGQIHLMNFWSRLTPEEKNVLLSDIAKINGPDLDKLQSVVQEPDIDSDYDPFLRFTRVSDIDFRAEGIDLCRQGKIGVVITAGGQGTRLGLNGPKGCYPVSNVRHKSLFQLFAEKIFYAGKLTGCKIPVAVMTSKENHLQTTKYFEEHNYFQLDKEQISFFEQSEAWFLDGDNNLFLNTPFSVAKGPDGNGAFFQSFVNSEIWTKWKKAGVEYVNYIQIDNPLADPVDFNLMGYHNDKKNDVTIKCVARLNPDEKVGVIVQSDKKVRVIEYSEISEKARNEQNENGELKYLCANISLFCMNMDFIQSVAENSDSILPYHIANKFTQHVDNKGFIITSGVPFAKKYEKFVFDMLPSSERIEALLYERADCFAPLKNRTGPDSEATVKTALLESDRNLWKKIMNTEPPEGVFELSQKFYYLPLTIADGYKKISHSTDPYIEFSGGL